MLGTHLHTPFETLTTYICFDFYNSKVW